MNKRESDYPVELESQFIMRLPEDPSKVLKDVLRTGENLKNRVSIQIDNDMRHGEVRFDHWLLHGKIVDLPTVVESVKTVDRKSVYKTADICQMMICKDEKDPVSTEEESPNKNKKRDPLKVDKKFLFPHGITPPTKNIRRRRFRKTLKKKSADGPEIEKEVKRLLRADYQAESMTWELIEEEDKTKPDTSMSGKTDKSKMKKELGLKVDNVHSSSKVEDIFGGALSDSDLEDENVDVDDSRLSSYGDHYSDFSVQAPGEFRRGQFATQFSSEMFESSNDSKQQPSISDNPTGYKSIEVNDSTNNTFNMQELTAELEELKQRRQKTQLQIVRIENIALRQRFQDVLQILNKDIHYKELEIKNLHGLLH